MDQAKPIVVGVSGGPDSLGLMHALHYLEYDLVVAHLNHGIRQESDEEELAVKNWAEKLSLKYYSKFVNVSEFSQQQGFSLEEAARISRYQFLFGVAEETHAQAVAVGHTADDQVETMLMHLLRGSGMAGLRGMRVRSYNSEWSQTIPLLRPLLSVWREEVLDYCEEHRLDPHFDRSNLDKTFYRNQLRHELIPLLETYNPQVKQVLLRTAETLQADFEVLQIALDQARSVCVHAQGDKYIGIGREMFLEQPLGIRRQLIRWALAELRPGLRDIDFEAVERALGFFAAPSRSGAADLIAGLTLVHAEGMIWIVDGDRTCLPAAGQPQLEAQHTALGESGAYRIDGGHILQVERYMNDQDQLLQALENQDSMRAYVDLGDQSSLLAVRRWKEGDRIQPLGMETGSMKMGDYFINVKLPQHARSAWPLVCLGDKIVWVPGHQIGHAFRVSPATKIITRLQLKKDEKKPA